MQNVSPTLPGTLCKPTIIACSGLLFPGYWVFQVASGHNSCWKTEELIQGRLKQGCQRLEPKAAEVCACQDGLSSKPSGWRVIPQLAFWNESLLTWSEKRYSCPFSSSGGVGSWVSGGVQAWCGTPWGVRVLGALFLDLSPGPQVCLLLENVQSSAFDNCAPQCRPHF